MKELIQNIAANMISDVKAGHTAESSARVQYDQLISVGFTPKGANMIIEQIVKFVINA